MKNRKTALVLSGGGARGAYQVGVWQALRMLDTQIDMVFGTSVGSINGAMIVQDKFDLSVQLWKELETDMIFDIDLTESNFDQSPSKAQKTAKKLSGKASLDKLSDRLSDKINEKISGSSMRRELFELAQKIEIGGMPLAEAKAYAREVISNGGAGNSGLRSLLDQYVDEDALRSSPIEYGLTTVELPTFTPYYMYKNKIPKGLLTDYILASSAVYPAIKAQEIGGKRFIDGGFADALPINMALDNQADVIISVYLDGPGILKKPDFEEAVKIPEKMITIESHWDLGNPLLFNRENTSRLINLGLLDGLKAFGVLQGEYFAFPNGEFDRKTIRLADAAANVFDLDPGKVYKAERLNDLILDELLKAETLTKTSPLEKLSKSLSGSAAFKKVPSVLVDYAAEKRSQLSEVSAKSVIVYHIAKFIKENPEAETFITEHRYIRKFPDEIRAAQYLLKAGLI